MAERTEGKGQSSGPGRVAARLADLEARHDAALEDLPDRGELAGRPQEARYAVLDGLRVELYALSAMLAGAIMRRAERQQASYQPYGLAKTKFAEWGLLKITSDTYEEGDIADFLTLWKGFVDTMVLNLHLELGAQRHSDQAWAVQRLDALLPLYATVGDDRTAARTRDTQTFLYGGLQFGVSVCVQLTEVMTRLLRGQTLSARHTRAVLARSVGPALRLAAMNLDHALPAYRDLLSTGEETPEEGRDRPGWLDAGKFVVHERDGRAHSVAFRDPEPDATIPTTYTTLGCPARLATSGRTPIARLWEWCGSVAYDAGLLA